MTHEEKKRALACLKEVLKDLEVPIREPQVYIASGMLDEVQARITLIDEEGYFPADLDADMTRWSERLSQLTDLKNVRRLRDILRRGSGPEKALCNAEFYLSGYSNGTLPSHIDERMARLEEDLRAG